MLRTSLITATLGLSVFVGGTFCVGTAAGGTPDPDYEVTITDAVGVGGNVDVFVLLDNQGVNLNGWSLGVCHDVGGLAFVGAVNGATTLTVQNGAPPDFNSIAVYATGWTVGVVIDFFGVFSLPPGSGYELNVATYGLLGSVGDVSDVCFCDTLGALAVQTVVVVQGGASVVPVQNCGQIEVVDSSFHFTAPAQSLSYDPVDGLVSFQERLRIREDAANPGFPHVTRAFSMGLRHNPAILSLVSVGELGPLPGLNGGAGPDFFGVHTYSNAFTVGCVYAFEMDQPLSFPAEVEVVSANYNSVPAALIGDLDGVTTTLTWDNTLGSPAVRNTVVVGLVEYATILHHGTITLAPPTIGAFIRGDANADGTRNIADPVYILNYLFSAGPGVCLEAQDTNDDSTVNIADPVYELNFLFAFGPAMPAPGPGCGADPTPDALGCVGPTSCP